MDSTQSQTSVNTENNTSVSSVLQMVRQIQNEALGQGSATKEVNPRIQLIKTPPTSDGKNGKAGRVGMLPTNKNVPTSPGAGEEKLPESGRVNRLAMPAKFQQDSVRAISIHKSTATGSSNEKKPNKVPNPEQKTRPTNTSGLRPSAPYAPSDQPSHTNAREAAPRSAAGESAPTAPTKFSSFKGQSSNLQLREHKINSPAEEQKGTSSNVVLEQKSACSNVVLYQRSGGKKFKKLNLDTPASRLPESKKTAAPSHIELSLIRQQYLRALLSLKKELQVFSPNKNENDDYEYLDAAPPVPSRQADSTLKSRHISIIPDISAEEEAYLVYHDGFTPLPVCVPDDGLYVEAVSERKVENVNVDQLNDEH